MSGRLLSSAFILFALVDTASAQWSLTSHLASDGTISGSPYAAGASVSSLTRQVGMRMGFSLDASGSAIDLPRRTALTVDFDGLYYPFGSPARAGIAPYGFLGLGGRSSSDAGGREVLTGSYGSGVELYLNEFFGLQMETRRRLPLNASDAGAAIYVSGWEYRFGVTFRLGRKSDPNPTPPAGPAPRPLRPVVFETYEAPLPAPVPARAAVAQSTIEAAEDYIGVPYKWGGTTPGGFDCSGLVQYVYRANGIRLPRVSRDQAKAGVSIPARLDLLEAGDLMFFASNGTRVDHVAIYTGDGHILHASKSKGEVGYDDLWSRRGEWYRRHFVSARRVID